LDQYRRFVDTLDVGVVVLDADGRLQTANRCARSILGPVLAPPDSGCLLAAGVDVVDEQGEPIPRERQPVAATLRTGLAQSKRIVGLRSNDTVLVWLLVSTEPQIPPGGELPVAVTCTVVDITSLRTAQDALRASEERFRLLAENAVDVIYRVRLSPSPVRFEYVSPAVRAILGWSPEELYADPQVALHAVHPDDRAGVTDLTVLNAEGAECVLVRMTRRDGTTIWTEHQVVAVRDAAGRVVSIEGIARDVTARQALEADLSHRALHDPLTGLPNRALLLDRLERGLARARRFPGLLAVLYVDLDRFKAVNDNLGHDAGDRLLETVARRLASVLRPSDSVARLGGDEFAAVLPDLHDEDEAIRIAHRVLEAVAQPVEVGGKERTTTASIGVAFADETPATAPEILRRADIAMYAAKDRGRARVERYGSQLGGAPAGG
jgi:diguanylate cyclase (GGDEF)-like protein/PAS domain S-box-containing protein